MDSIKRHPSSAETIYRFFETAISFPNRFSWGFQVMTPLLLKCCRKSCLIKTILKSFLKKHINSFNHHLLSFYYVQGVTIVENQWEKISRCGRQCTCHSFPEARLLQMKNPPAIWETQVQSLGQEDPLEKEMATHSSILAWEIPRTEQPGGLQSKGWQRVGHDWLTLINCDLISHPSWTYSYNEWWQQLLFWKSRHT